LLGLSFRELTLMKRKLVFFVPLLVVLSARVSLSQGEPSVLESVVDGEGREVGMIDWTHGHVAARGAGETVELAVANAREILYQVLLVVPVDDATCVGDRVHAQSGYALPVRELAARGEVTRTAPATQGREGYVACVKVPMLGAKGLLTILWAPPPALPSVTKVPVAVVTEVAESRTTAHQSQAVTATLQAAQPEAESRRVPEKDAPPKASAAPVVAQPAITREGKQEPATTVATPNTSTLLALAEKTPQPTTGSVETTVPETSARPNAATSTPQTGAPATKAATPPQAMPSGGVPAAVPDRPTKGASTELPPLNAPTTGPFTGLIVDCRGIGVKRCISPILMTEGGKTIYGRFPRMTDAQIEESKRVGVVGYLGSPEHVLKSRAGERPLVVRALRVEGNFIGNPIISDADGERILAENSKARFFDKWKVAFLVD